MKALHCLTTACLLFLECSWVFCNEDELHCLKSSIDKYSVKKYQLEHIKQEILLRLNLTVAPENPDLETLKRYKESESVLNSYNAASSAQKLRDDNTKPCVELDRKSSNVSTYFPTQVETSPAPGTNDALFNTLWLKFQLDMRDKNDHDYTKAELRLYKIVIDQNSTVRERVDIYLVSDSANYYGSSIHDFTFGAEVKADRNGYIIFDVLTAINKWRKNNPTHKGELKLKVQIRTAEKSGYSLPPVIQFVADNFTTQLVISTTLSQQYTPIDWGLVDDADSQDKRRQTTVEPIECTLRPLSVNVSEDLNFKWILFPQIIELNYCSGLCGRINAGTRHAQYLERRESITGNPLGSSDPCCVPNGYETKTVSVIPLQPEDGSPGPDSAIETLEDITITSCVCR